jgi:HK97 family phage prohead protease
MKRKFFNIESKSLSALGITTQKELWEKAKAKGYDGLSISVETVLTKDANNKFHAVFSTADEDRHGDVVEQNWDLKSYKKNPVYLDSHNYDSIEHIIGRITSLRSKEGLQGDIEFALDNPKGLLAFKLAEGGFLNTSSVGFIPKEFSDKGNITKSELLEISAVSVPANPEALFEKDYEPDDTHNDETEEPNGETPAGDGDGGETDGGDSEPADNGDGGVPEVTGKPEPVEPPKPTPQQLAVSAVRNLAQERGTILTNVLSAVRALSKQPKVETPARDRAKEKRAINAAIRELIKQKHQLS